MWFVCVYDKEFLFWSTNLDDVRRDDKLRRSAVTLFTWGALSSQAKDPLHLVPKTLFA